MDRSYKNMHATDFWDRVKPSNIRPQDRPAWMTFDDEWVDQVQRGLKACNVFLFYPIYCRLLSDIYARKRQLKKVGLAHNQMTNNLTSQAATMRLDNVPNDILNNLNPLALVVFIPICDLWIYPALRKAKVQFTPLKRITAGFLMGTCSMIWAAVIQYYIYKTHPCGKRANSCEVKGSAPISVWVQTGAYGSDSFRDPKHSHSSLKKGLN
jgi:POT family proton-dependent oligopeptide transporter